MIIPFDPNAGTQALARHIPSWKTGAKQRVKCFQWTPADGAWQTVCRTGRSDSIMASTSLVILGSGYSGRFLEPLVAQQYRHVYSASRDPDRNLCHLQANQRIAFDLTSPDTWTNIPTSANLLWCFPAAPLELVQRFALSADASSRRLVVLGSTSAYDVADTQEYPPPWIDETAPLDFGKTRVRGEEYLRKDCGAIVLRVAGIYGPGRNPLDWIRQGRVGPSRKYVNLIHVEDLALICLAALERGKPGEIYNVSDGQPHTWEEICTTARDRWNIPHSAGPNTDTPGKRINTNKLTTHLGVQIHHSDLFTALEALDQSCATSAEEP